MIWDIELSSKSKEDLKNIKDYISNELNQIKMAEKQVKRITKSIRKLNMLPLRHQLYNDKE